MEFLYLVPEWVIIIAIILIFTICAQLCFAIGKKHSGKVKDHEQVSILSGALIGFLAFFLGFALVMAHGRFDAGEELLHQEINDINATYLNADFLVEPYSREMKLLLKEYTGLRVEYTKAISRKEVEQIVARTAVFHHRIWKEALVALEHSPSRHTDEFLSSLQNMLRDHEKLTTAKINHVPEEILWLLLVLSVMTIGTNSYRSGLKKESFTFLWAMFIFCITITLFLIIDLDRPRRGLMRIDQSGVMRLYETMRQDLGESACVQKH